MSSITAVKVIFDGETRRFPRNALPLHSLDGVRAVLAGEFPTLPPATFVLRYTDEEGDEITVRSQSEWEEALACLRSGSKVPRFTLAANGERKSKPASKEGGELPPFRSLLDDLFKEIVGEKEDDPMRELFATLQPMAKMMQEQIQKETEKKEQEGGPFAAFGGPLPFFFGAGHCQPSSEAEGAKGEKKAPQRPRQGQFPPRFSPHGNGFFWAERANNSAVEMMEAGDYEGAKALLEAAADRCPSHASTRYNLACTLALMGSPEPALASLTSAVALGFVNFSLMETDPDLKSLHGLPEFERLLNTIRPQAPAGAQDPEELQAAAMGERQEREAVEAAVAVDIATHPTVEQARATVEEWGIPIHISYESDHEEDSEEEDGGAFPFAQEFAEVREIGIPVSDSTLRSLLLTHKGDVGETMAQLCTTPRG